MKKYKKGNKHTERKTILFELQSSTELKTSPIPSNLQRKNKSVHWQRFYKPGKNVIFPFHQYWKEILVRNNFQGTIYVNLHDGSKTLKFEDIVRLKVMLRETIRNNDL